MNNIFFSLDAKDITPISSEVARYLGYKKSSVIEDSINALIDKAINEMKMILKPQGVFEIFPITSIDKLNNDTKPLYKISFADLSIETRDLGYNLKDCSKVCLIAGTIGPLIDSYIRKATMLAPAYASICQATGAMYIECFIDKLNNHIKDLAKDNNETTNPRYSPGYGDVPLSFQKEFFRLLNCKRIGLSLMDTLIMAPEKSVTAFIGIKNK